MHEINKLKQRLTHIGKNTTEYRMTVGEARNLIREIDILLKKIEEKPQPVVIQEESKTGSTIVVDGGSF
jgi:hypothetical protein